MAYDVDVKIDLVKVAGKLSFGVPLIIEEGVESNKVYTECKDLIDIVNAGYAANSEVYNSAALIFMQTNRPEKIAVCSTTGTTAEKLVESGFLSRGWRQLLVVTAEGDCNIAEISKVIEGSTDKMFFYSCPVSSAAIAGTSGNVRTVAMYCNSAEGLGIPAAALVGETAGRQPGSFTYKNIILKGIAPQKLTDSEIEVIHEKGGLTFVQKAGDNVTSQGETVGGEYIDVVDSKDYVIQQIAYRTQKLLNQSSKIPYDNSGIAQLESVTVSVMQEAFAMGIIAVTADGEPDYTVDFGTREESTPQDRQARIYTKGSFSFALAGAVHFARITGEITL